MKYDILEAFNEYLKENLSPNTAKTYYAAVVKLFRDMQFKNLSEIDPHWMEKTISEKFKNRAEFSAAKNGLKWLKKFDSRMSILTEQEFKAISCKKRNFSKKPKKVIYLNPTRRKINQITNERLRFAFRLAEVSGLRVSELADLEAQDISFEGDKIFVEVRNGKGGHGGRIECRADPYLTERLPEFLQKIPEGKIFYSRNYMIECAGKLGIECHDLRRIFAIQSREELKKEMPVEQANQIVQERLRHTRFSVTKRYLFNRKLRFEYEKEKPEGEAAADKEVKFEHEQSSQKLRKSK